MRRYHLLTLLLLCFCFQAEAKRIIDLNTENGLSSSLINCLFQDSTGDIWIGTENGLNRFNGVSIKVYKFQPGQPFSLSDNCVRTIIQDSKGNLLIGSQGGVQIYNREKDCFSAPIRTEDGQEYRGNVNAIIERDNGEIWVSGNRLMKISLNGSEEPVLTPVTTQLPSEMTGDLVEDAYGDVWLAKFNSGIYRLTKDGSFYHYQSDFLEGPYNKISMGSDKSICVADNHGNLVRFDRSQGVFVKEESESISDYRINTLLLTDDGHTYLGTDGNGIFVNDSETGIFSQLDLDGLEINMEKAKVHCMLFDKEGNLWIGIYQRGVVMVPAENSTFWYFGRKTNDYDLIGTCSVTSLLIDSNRKIWVGTDNDGVYELEQPLKLKKHYTLEDGLPGTCFGLMEDSTGNIWFGTYSRGVWRINTKTGKVQSGSEISGAPIDDRSIYAIAEDSRGRIWLGSLGNYLCYYDLRSGKTFFPDLSNTDLSKWVNDILILNNTLYAASYDGLFSIDISGDAPAVKQQILNDKVIYSVKSDEDILYCCTSDGVITISLTDGNITSYTTVDGLADNMVHDLIVASHGKVWFSTGAGLSLFEASSGNFTNFYPDDGFQVSEFSWKTSAVDADNNLLLFGGSDGVAIFNPEFVQPSQKPLPTRIVNIHASGRYIPLADDNSYILKYNENSCNISFTTADYNAPAGVVFSYSTDGKNWAQLPLGQHNIILSKLTPGRYRLMVKAIDRGNESEPMVVNIRVKHPWWGSLLAKLFYLAFGILAIALFFVLLKRDIESKREIERHTQAEEANEDKVKFFINLSHEIRSPLTLISAPLQSLIDTDHDPSRQHTYSVMDKSVKQVLQIVNQVLDVRKLEKGSMTLSFSPVNIVEYVSSFVMLFKEQAGIKGLNLAFRYDGMKEQEVWIDPNYFGKVIINLLSNAIKYTPKGGSINVTVTSEVKNVRIEVKDTGVGLSDEDLKKVFDRFYQAPNAVSGTGIGLNLAKMLTDLHYGTIEGSHNPEGQGCVFTVTLPLGNAHLKNEQITDSASKNEYVISEAVNELPPADIDVEEAVPMTKKKRTILVAEDNYDIRQYLKTEFSDKYNVILCEDGKSAYNRIIVDMPALVISDVAMPEMDGFQLCRKIRNNPNISHIPLILLTARTLDQDNVEGMEAGADAYMTKPFNIMVLKQTVSNLLGTREKLKVSFSEAKVKESDIKNIEIKTPDDRLLERVVKVLNDNISNPDLTVEDVAHEVGISRVHLHRKLKELTNQTSRDFIRNVRLKKAAEMLSEKKHSIAELADAVGFTNQTSFSTSFKELYGMSPSEYRSNIEKQGGGKSQH